MSGTFKIERNIEQERNERGVRYPWAEMEVGDSFFLPTTDRARAVRSAVNAGLAWCARNQPGRSVSYRSVDGGIRIWMVERNGEG
jgi:hypothetical protein